MYNKSKLSFQLFSLSQKSLKWGYFGNVSPTCTLISREPPDLPFWGPAVLEGKDHPKTLSLECGDIW